MAQIRIMAPMIDRIHPAGWNLPSDDFQNRLPSTPPTSDPPMPSSVVIQNPRPTAPRIEITRQYADDEADDDHSDDAHDAHGGLPYGDSSVVGRTPYQSCLAGPSEIHA